MQIRTRLTFQFILLAAGILGFSLMFFYSKYSQLVVKEHFYSLKSRSANIAERILKDYNPATPSQLKQKDSFALVVNSNVEIYNSKFQKVFALNSGGINLDSDEMVSLMEDKEICSTDKFDINKIGYTFLSADGDKFYVIAQKKMNMEDLISIQYILWLTMLIGLLIAAVGGWWYTKQALSPVKTVVDQVESMLPSNLNVRIVNSGSKDEINHLILTFNRLLDRIEEAFAMQKNFISNVSHELKNPISVITSQLEVLLQQKSRTEDEYKRSVQSVLEDSYRLSDITDNLLQMARLHSEQGSVNFSTVRIDDLLLESRNLLLKSNSDYKIDIDIVGDPLSEEDFCVSGNKSLLRSAFMNIMDNCCKYSQDKYVDVKIYFEKNGHRRLEMADDGPGIKTEDIPLVFKPFYRDPKSKHKKGSGIGLSLVDSVMKIHQFSIDIDSTKGQGTIFKGQFPLYSPN